MGERARFPDKIQNAFKLMEKITLTSVCLIYRVHSTLLSSCWLQEGILSK